MRISKLSTLLSLLSATSYALGSTLTQRADPSVSDICANINVGVLNTALIAIGIHGNICLCLSLVGAYVDAHVGAGVGADSRVAAQTALILLINSASGKKTCSYPPHYVPECNSNDPCDWHCTDGYKRNGDKCVCPFGKHDCGDKCTDSLCPSGGYRKRDMQPLKSFCPPGHDLCGVYSDNWASRSSWECVDTHSNLESCGGCVTPVFGTSSTGRDCSAIKGVNSVNCHKSKCRVTSCRTGWMITAAGDDCVKIMI